MHDGVQTAAVAIFSYILLSGLNVTVYLYKTALEIYALLPFGVYKPLMQPVLTNGVDTCTLSHDP